MRRMLFGCTCALFMVASPVRAEDETPPPVMVPTPTRQVAWTSDWCVHEHISDPCRTNPDGTVSYCVTHVTNCPFYSKSVSCGPDQPDC